jgi:hypothetical protein
VHAAALALLLIASAPPVAGVFGPSAGEFARTMRQDMPTLMEAGELMRGYYEEIAGTRVRPGSMLKGLIYRGEEYPLEYGHYGDAIQPSGDLLMGPELRPGWHGKLGFAETTVNRFGMRDRDDITLSKPANTCRIALVGSSAVMGYGVEDGEVFKCLLENKLNAAAPAAGPRFELLNFAMGRTSSLNRALRFERKILAFQPDVLYYIAHQDELYFPREFMAGIVAQKLPQPYPFMAELIRQSGATPDTPPAELEGIFLRLGREVTLGIYRVLVEDCRQHGILPVWVYLPMPGIQRTPADAADVIKVAEQAGFVVVNMANWTEGHTTNDLKLDLYHPSVLGHQVIAERLFAEIKKRPEMLPEQKKITNPK